MEIQFENVNVYTRGNDCNKNIENMFELNVGRLQVKKRKRFQIECLFVLYHKILTHNILQFVHIFKRKSRLFRKRNILKF